MRGRLVSSLLGGETRRGWLGTRGVPRVRHQVQGQGAGSGRYVEGRVVYIRARLRPGKHRAGWHAREWSSGPLRLACLPISGVERSANSVLGRVPQPQSGHCYCANDAFGRNQHCISLCSPILYPICGITELLPFFSPSLFKMDVNPLNLK
jgi:hypothetical protein